MCDIRVSLEIKAYQQFCNKFHNGEFGTQRLGQAFYDHFKLEKMSNQEQANKIYYAPTEAESRLRINEVFNIH